MPLDDRKHKIAANESQAFEMQEKYTGLPHCWLQWKGTEVCMDFFCKCGVTSHIDADFTYNIQCPSCGTIYACNGHIELIELKEPPSGVVVVGDE